MMKVPSCKRISFRAHKTLAYGGKKLHLISYKELRKLIRSEVRKCLKQNKSKNANGNRLITNYLNEKSLANKLQLGHDDIREIIVTEVEKIVDQCFIQNEKRCPTRLIAEDYSLMIKKESMPRADFHVEHIERLKSEMSSRNQLCDNYVKNLYKSVLNISAELNTVTERLESIECAINKDQTDSEDIIENIMERFDENQSDSDESNEMLSSNANLSISDDNKSMPDILKNQTKYETFQPIETRKQLAYEDYEIYFSRNKTCDNDFFKNLTPQSYTSSENQSIKDNDEYIYTHTHPYNTNDLVVAKVDKERKIKRTHQKETICPQCCLIRSCQEKSSMENLH